MPIDLSIETEGAPEGLLPLLEKVADACFRTEGIAPAAFSVRLTDGETVRSLNSRLRGIDSETDVLSFPEIAYATGRTAGQSPKRLRAAYDPIYRAPYLGDCAISVPRAVTQAREFGHTPAREICYLVCHSLFHLMGYDHMTEEDRSRMRLQEKAAMSLAGITRDGSFMISDEKLFALAEEAMKNSYSPYSQFKVGAAILTDTGHTFTGCNFENASYPAGICAERCAVSCAIAAGERHFLAVAIAAEKGVAWPCGVCRQVLREFSLGDMRVIVGQAGSGKTESATLSQLLPHSFGPEDLGQKTEA